MPAALRLVAATLILDGAILDIDLHGQPSFAVADALQARGIPFVFTTGYGSSMIPEPYWRVPRFENRPLRYVFDVIADVSRVRDDVGLEHADDHTRKATPTALPRDDRPPAAPVQACLAQCEAGHPYHLPPVKADVRRAV